MSKNEDSNNNAFIIGASVAVIAALLAFFTFSGTDTSLNSNSVNIDNASDKALSVKKVVTTDQPEEIVVIGKSAQDTKDAEKKATLAEKANEAAIRTQVNEEMKSSEDTDFSSAE